MPRTRRYNFRYQAERERFYDDTVNDQTEYAQKYDDYGYNSATEFIKSLRIVFDIGDFTSTKRKQHVESVLKKGVGKFRGIRSFINFDTLKKFLDSTREGGSGIQWGKKEDEDITARLCFYQRRRNRIIGEKVLVKYIITTARK